MTWVLGKNKAGHVTVVFSDVDDVEEVDKVSKNGKKIKVLSFTEDGVDFTYILRNGIYTDLEGNGPTLKDYEITTDKKRVNEILDHWNDGEAEADEDEEEDAEDWLDALARANANHTRGNSSSSGSSGSYGCGPGSMGGACGGSSSSSSGSYGCGGGGGWRGC